MDVLSLFPPGTRVERGGQLALGDCRATALAEEYGTPLYVLDRACLQERCQLYRRQLEAGYPGQAHVAYASKAGLNLALAQLFAGQGLDLDVVSGGELFVARQAGFPADRIYLHGNNKSQSELEMALDEGIGRIVVDNLYELDLLSGLAEARGRRVRIWLRLCPGIDVHTHVYRKTGLLDSKFGFSLETGAAEAGFVYATDAAASDQVKIAIEIPWELTEPVLYPALLLKRSVDNEIATAFFDYLRSPDATDIFQKFGFVMLAEADSKAKPASDHFPLSEPQP